MRIGELSRRTGVGVHTLRAWERRYGVITPQRTPGGTRLYAPMDEARIKLMRRYVAEGASTADAAEMTAAAALTVPAGRAARVPPDEAGRARGALREALDRFDETAAVRVLEPLFARFAPLLVIRDVLLPFMAGVGRRWERGEADVSQEHFATQFVETRLRSMTRGWDRGLGPRGLLACAPGEQHTLGLIALGLSLHAQGWRITFLGADTSAAALAFAARALRPDVVIVSQTMPGRPGLDARSLDCPVLLAGPAASPSIAAAIGAQHLAGNAVDAAWAAPTSQLAQPVSGRPPPVPRPSA
jgi:DNA-binding transcriptional MerR regulator